jgi:hypothetical protein
MMTPLALPHRHRTRPDPSRPPSVQELSVEGILRAVKGGRTVVRFLGRDDPMAVLETTPPLPPDSSTLTLPASAAGTNVTLTVTVSGVGKAKIPRVRLVHNGVAGEWKLARKDPTVVTVTVTVPPPEGPVEMWRAEVYALGPPDGVPRPAALTNYVYIRTER